MLKISLLATLVALCSVSARADSHATATDETDAIATDVMAQDVDLDAAAKIFQRNCRACHGNKAQGVASYPKLSDKEPDYIAERLKTYRSGERIGPNSVLMIQNAKDLSDAEIASLAVYVTTAFD